MILIWVKAFVAVVSMLQVLLGRSVAPVVLQYTAVLFVWDAGPDEYETKVIEMGLQMFHIDI